MTPLQEFWQGYMNERTGTYEYRCQRFEARSEFRPWVQPVKWLWRIILRKQKRAAAQAVIDELFFYDRHTGLWTTHANVGLQWLSDSTVAKIVKGAADA